MNQMVKLSFCLTLCLIVAVNAKKDLLLEDYGSLGTKADFYDEEYLAGLQLTVETAGPCKNLPKRWLKRAQSVDTKGTCISVCEDKDCQGLCKRVYPNNGEQQLKTVKFEKRISSYKGCFQ